MITFKLCKQYNNVEITYDSLSEIDVDQLNAIYDILPDYAGTVVEAVKEQPTESQIKYAKALGIDVTGMDKEELRVAIQKKAGKAK